MYYVSQFLNIYPALNGTRLLFHGVTGAIDEVTNELGHLLSRLKRTKEPVAQTIPPDIVHSLASRGHLTPLDAEQEQKSYEKYVSRLHELKTKVNSGYLMLIPSYSCNLCCPYCFQNQLRQTSPAHASYSMSPSYADLLFQRAIPAMYEHLNDDLLITIYGGEPFTPANKASIDRILHYTQIREHRVNAISNGTMISQFPEFFGSTIGLINGVQISLDGDRASHDQSRIPATKDPTFDKILTAIKWLSDKDVEVLVRVNVTEDNSSTLSSLNDTLRMADISTRDNVSIYCRAVHPIQRPAEEISFPNIFSQWKLSTHMAKLQSVEMKSPLDRTCGSLRKVMTARSGIPLTRTQFCMQNRPGAYIIDLLGDVYGCYDEAGYREKRIGNIDAEGRFRLDQRYHVYQSRTLLSQQPCRKCSIGLTCGGGCPVLAETANGSIFSSYCDSQKELVATAVAELHHKRKHKTGFPTANDSSVDPELTPLA